MAKKNTFEIDQDLQKAMSLFKVFTDETYGSQIHRGVTRLIHEELDTIENTDDRQTLEKVLSKLIEQRT